MLHNVVQRPLPSAATHFCQPLKQTPLASSRHSHGVLPVSSFSHCRPGDPEPLPQEEPKLAKPEMFENPLYGSVSSFPKPAPRREQESPKMLRKEPPPCPDTGSLSPSILLSKAQEAEGSKGTGKPVPAPTPFLSPTPRLRSFTTSAEGRPAAGDKSQGKAKAPAGTPVPVPAKRPVKPSRSEQSHQSLPTPAPRPPLPVKSPAVLHLQYSKGRDYRENTELPYQGKHRPPEDSPLSRATTQVRWGACECVHVGSCLRMCTCVTTTVPRTCVRGSSHACMDMCVSVHDNDNPAQEWVPANSRSGSCSMRKGWSRDLNPGLL